MRSKFTSKLSFEQPSTHPAISTYRVMDSDGVIVDKARALPDVSDEEVLLWYKNMLTGGIFLSNICVSWAKYADDVLPGVQSVLWISSCLTPKDRVD